MENDNNSLLPKVSSASLFYTLAAIILVVIILIYFETIIKPIFIAMIIWFLIKQLKDGIGRIRVKGRALPGWLRSILALLVILIFFYSIIELLIINIEMIVAAAPEYADKLTNLYNTLVEKINNPNVSDYLRENLEKLNIAGMAGSVINSISSALSNLAVILVFAIFFILEEAIAGVKIEKLFPGRGEKYEKFKHNLNQVSDSVRSYLVSKTIISLITGVISYIALLILGIDFAFLWAFLVFILNYIPYVGPLISSLLPAVFAILFKGELIWFVYVFVVLEGIQIILGNFVEPAMMGKSLNLSPLAVLVALSFWSAIWGVVGMILSVPITSVMVIIMGQVPSSRYLAILLSEKGEVGN
jgi:predicted PurR-regulated permease PerM